MLDKGSVVPKLKLLEGLSDEHAKQIERDLIRLIGRFPKGPLVNLTDGGDGVANLSAESRSRMGGWRGKHHSEETGAKIRAARLGSTHSAETRAKISAISRAMSPETKAKIGRASRNMPTETRAKIAAAGRGRKRSDESRERMRVAQSAPGMRERKAAVRAASNKARVYTPEMRAKLSAYARNRSPEWSARQSASKRGKHPSAETRAKLSAAHRGLRRSPEAIAKTAAANRGAKRSDQARANIREGIRRNRQKRQLSLFTDNKMTDQEL